MGTDAEQLIYEGNPKHKAPWEGGRRGSLCPRDVSVREAQRLLDASLLHVNARYATRDGVAFCAREHGPGLWHGYPVGWREVPPHLRRNWQREGLVRNSDIKRNW